MKAESKAPALLTMTMERIERELKPGNMLELSRRSGVAPTTLYLLGQRPIEVRTLRKILDALSVPPEERAAWYLAAYEGIAP